MAGKKKAKTKAKTKTAKRTTKDGKDLVLINFRVTTKDKAALKRMAVKFAGGSVAHWLRYIGLNGRPLRGRPIGEAA